MSEPDEQQLRRLLRDADPAASLPPADPARVDSLLEDAVSTTRPTPDLSSPDVPAAPAAPRTLWRRPWVLATAAAAVLALAAVPVVRSLTAEPVTTTLTASASSDGLSMSCLPVGDFLPQASLAFAGTVAADDGQTVTLDVGRVYRGEPGDRVEVRADMQDTAATVGGFPFEVGQEYLVAATDGVVAVCGGSGPVTPELQAEYERAFGG